MIARSTDLLGAPAIQRDAWFTASSVRISLSRTWSPGPRAVVIGHNPSDAGCDRDDATSRWWNAWFHLFGFGGYDAFNLYPFVSSDPRDCQKIVADIDGGVDWGARDALHFVSLPALVKAAKSAHQVFVCWGALAFDPDWVGHVVEEIQSGIEPHPDLWCWGKNADGSPKHPMARGRHRIPADQQPILWRAA